jgi:hypothetical protein
MAESFTEIKRKSTEQQKTALLEEYNAAMRQFSMTLGEVDRVRLHRQIESLEEQILRIDKEIGKLNVIDTNVNQVTNSAKNEDVFSAQLQPGLEKTYGTGQQWAVLIGVNTYDDKSNYGQLSVCVKDAQVIQQQLIDGGFDAQHIRLLTDNTYDLPTRANILQTLKAVASATEPDDLLLFYYSGHGEEDNQGSYLVAKDGRHLVLPDTAVSIERLETIMSEASARAKVIILDACHSGANFGGKGPKCMSKEFIERVFKQAKGMAILASCEQGQFSYEWFAKERSAFTYYLVEALRGDADYDKKGFVTVFDANRHVIDGVKLWASQKNLNQTPTLHCTIVGDIILTRQSPSEK